jgi:hypothetical protein
MNGFERNDERSRLEKTAPFSTGVVILLAAAALLLFFGPAFVVHARLAMDPVILNDDARQQIWPLYRLLESDLFAGDLIASYYLDCMPVGFKFVYSLGGLLASPATISRILPYVLLFAVVFGVGVTGFRIARWSGLFISLASVLGSAIYLDRMTGGLPRAFGFPLVAILMLLLARGRVMAFAAVAVASVAFYPSVAVIGGGALALWMSFSRYVSPELGLKPWKRIALVAVSAALMGALHAPVIDSCSAYGPSLSAADRNEFPELGPRGRYLPEDRAPFGMPAGWFLRSAISGLETDSLLLPEWSGRGMEWPLLFLAAVGGAGSLLACRSDFGLRRVWLLAPAALGAYAAASALYPSLYVPTRYPTVVMPLLAPVVCAAGLRWLVGRVGFPTGRKSSIASAVAASALVFAAVMTPAPEVARAGWNVRIPNEDLALHSFLGTLSRNVLIAGWPGRREPIESVPYLTQRPVLLSRETHQVFHERYALEMRRRMGALIELFIDADESSPRRLHDEFGVTHVIVRKDREWLARLDYMEPYGSAIRRRRKASMEELQSVFRGETIVYQDAKWLVLQIRGVASRDERPPGSPRPGDP